MSVTAFLRAIESPDLRCVADHWLDVRGAEPTPTWSQIRPSAIARQLHIVWSFTYDPERSEFVGRLGGHAISKIVDRSLKGVPMADLEPFLDSRRLEARAQRVLHDMTLFWGRGEIFRRENRWAHGERIIMPLASDDSSETGVLGATVYEITRMGDQASDSREAEEWFPLLGA